MRQVPFFKITAFESLFENSSREMVLCSIGEGNPLQLSVQLQEGHTWVRKEGETHLAGQSSQINLEINGVTDFAARSPFIPIAFFKFLHNLTQITPVHSYFCNWHKFIITNYKNFILTKL